MGFTAIYERALIGTKPEGILFGPIVDCDLQPEDDSAHVLMDSSVFDQPVPAGLLCLAGSRARKTNRLISFLVVTRMTNMLEQTHCQFGKDQRHVSLNIGLMQAHATMHIQIKSPLGYTLCPVVCTFSQSGLCPSPCLIFRWITNLLNGWSKTKYPMSTLVGLYSDCWP